MCKRGRRMGEGGVREADMNRFDGGFLYPAHPSLKSAAIPMKKPRDSLKM